MARSVGYGRIQKPRFKRKIGATTVKQRIRTRARRIGFGFKKALPTYGK